MAYAGMHIQRREFYQFCQRAETRNVRASGADGGTDTFFRLGTTAKDSDRYRVLVDEVVILKRALSDEEIRKLYDESIKVMPGKK